MLIWPAIATNDFAVKKVKKFQLPSSYSTDSPETLNYDNKTTFSNIMRLKLSQYVLLLTIYGVHLMAA